jgi:hypothetical protein
MIFSVPGVYGSECPAALWFRNAHDQGIRYACFKQQHTRVFNQQGR